MHELPAKGARVNSCCMYGERELTHVGIKMSFQLGTSKKMLGKEQISIKFHDDVCCDRFGLKFFVRGFCFLTPLIFSFSYDLYVFIKVLQMLIL